MRRKKVLNELIDLTAEITLLVFERAQRKRSSRLEMDKKYTRDSKQRKR